MKKQHTLSDVEDYLDKATDALQQIQLRTFGEMPELSFEQRIINAARLIDDNSLSKESAVPRDYLGLIDINQAISTLADIYIVTGVRMPENWD